MGIITVLLYSTGYLHGEFHVPHWVALSCYVAIGLGTLTGGWRIIETMGTRITKLSSTRASAASAGGSVMLFAASYLGIPVSTTHTITGCVIGAGAARRASAVRWGVAGNVMIAWVITIPASAAVAALVLLADQRHFPPRRGNCRTDRVRRLFSAGLAAPELSGRSAPLDSRREPVIVTLTGR